MRFSIILILIIISFDAFAQGNFEQKVLKAFDSYVPQIEATNDLELKFRKVFLGDLNQDQIDDAIVEFGLGSPDGNGILLKQAAVYLNENGAPSVVAGFEPSYCFNIVEIKDSRIKINELEACMLPFPEVVSTHYFQLEGNRLIKNDN